MKKIIILFTAFLFSPYINHAQDSREKLVFGLKAGATLSGVYDQKGENFAPQPKVGFTGGAFLGIPTWKYVGFQPEILFTQRGFRSTGTILGNPYSDTRTTSFLDIPLQVQFKPQDFITFLGGIQYSHLLYQNDVYTFGTNNAAQEQALENDNTRKNIFSAVFGIDYNIRHFIISGRGNWDLQNNAGNGPRYMPRYKNIWFQLSVGFRLYR